MNKMLSMATGIFKSLFQFLKSVKLSNCFIHYIDFFIFILGLYIDFQCHCNFPFDLQQLLVQYLLLSFLCNSPVRTSRMIALSNSTYIGNILLYHIWQHKSLCMATHARTTDVDEPQSVTRSFGQKLTTFIPLIVIDLYLS